MTSYASLTRYKSPPASSENISAFASIGLSAWYDFVEESGEARFKQGELLSRLCDLLQSKRHEVPLDALLCALSTEAAHWTQNIENAQRRKILKQLVQLLVGGGSTAIRSRVASTIAVLALAMHDHRGTPNTEQPAESRLDRAKKAARYYAKQNTLDDREVDDLLLYGLAGMMEHYEDHGLGEEDLDNISAISEQLKQLHNLGSSRTIALPDNFLPSDFDIRAYVVDILVQYLHRPPSSGKLILPDDTYVTLLEVVSHRPYIWFDHSTQLILPISTILQKSSHSGVQRQCLVAMAEYWNTAPSYLDLQVIFNQDIPYKLVSFMGEDADHVKRSHAISHFDSLTQRLQTSEWSKQADSEKLVSGLLGRIIDGDFFEIFFVKFLCRADKNSKQNRDFWGDRLKTIAKSAKNDPQLLVKLGSIYRYDLAGTELVEQLGEILFPNPNGRSIMRIL